MDEIPIGLCQCGCGGATKVATQAIKRYGYAKGEPMRYLSGHSKNRLGTGKTIEAPNPSGLCMCGCGQTTPLAKKTNTTQGLVEGEHTRFFPSHGRKNRGKRVPGARHVDPGDGYAWIFLPDHPSANRGGYVREHRLVAEKMLGRPLTSDDHVHHRHAPKSDNRPENLLVTTNSEHGKLHRREDTHEGWWAGYLGFTKCLSCDSAERPHYSRGYCNACYQGLRRRGDLTNLPAGRRTKQPRGGVRAQAHMSEYM